MRHALHLCCEGPEVVESGDLVSLVAFAELDRKFRLGLQLFHLVSNPNFSPLSRLADHSFFSDLFRVASFFHLHQFHGLLTQLVIVPLDVPWCQNYCLLRFLVFIDAACLSIPLPQLKQSTLVSVFCVGVLFRFDVLLLLLGPLLWRRGRCI